jgi:sulfate adenylyltransferase/3'-phosphoadenosine 5'-phosphosulfate synthase
LTTTPITQQGFTVWFTGLSGAGKTTISVALEKILRARGVKVERLDGDVVREGLTRDLGFSKEDRDKNIERVTFVAKMLSRNGVGVLSAFISPYRAARDKVRAESTNFIEVYVSTPIEVCAERDVKGMYAKAFAGEIKNFTGVSDPYEAPENPEITIATVGETVEQSAARVIRYLEDHNLIPRVVTVDVPQPADAEDTTVDTSKLIKPHGGFLVNRVLTGDARNEALERAQTLPKIALSDVNIADLEMIAGGGLSPLTGYLERADYETVVKELRLANGLPWSIPVTLAVDEEQAKTIPVGSEVALTENRADGAHILAILKVHDKYSYDREAEAQNVYKTTETAHPGVARLYKQGSVLLGGPIWLIDWPERTRTEFSDIRYTPVQTRRIFAERGWRRIVGFQTRNPIHRAHEYIQKTALEVVDGLFLQPLVGETKSDDVPAATRVESYRAILDAYYPKSRVLLGVFPAAMRYAGPREAIFHAIARKNYGCSHFIVGRDHAGVGKYYGSYDAHLIFDQFTPEEIGITPLFFEHTFYCKRCSAVVSAKTCPHGPEDYIVLSGTQVREKLARGEELPVEFTRPEVAEILRREYQRQALEKEEVKS